MVVKPLSSLPAFASVLGGIDKELPVEKTWSVSICPNTSTVHFFLFPSSSLFYSMQTLLLMLFLCFKRCHSLNRMLRF